MIVSLNWLKQYVDIDMPVDELATLVGARLVEIEEVIDLGKKYKNIYVAKVVSCEKHPSADKLKICLVDDGKKAKSVQRNKQGLVQVVCGAPNVKEGMKVAWLPPGATVPSSFDEKEPFVLGDKELRGVKSSGMLASAAELAIGDSHEGLLEIDASAKPGDDFAKTYMLDDYLLDIENKSLTHRPDCFGVIGLAREIAAISGKKFKTPGWLLDTKASVLRSPSAAAPINVSVKNPELCSRYQAVVLSNVDAEVASSVQLQTWLARVGIKPINSVVDATNYLMLLTGQPLHAFDYDKFIKLNSKGAEVVVRSGKKGEKLALLDSREITLTEQDIVIASGDIPVALAGAMGGASTAIDSGTKNVLLESASFNLYNLRGTQMRHGIFTDSITRFTKGQSPEQTAPVLAEAVNMLVETTEAEVASKVVDTYPGKQKQTSLSVNVNFINNLLGTNYSVNVVANTLKNVEFEVEQKSGDLSIKAPYWRADINIPEDIAEEIGRINGFDEIKTSLPTRSFTASSPTELEKLKQNIRKIMSRAGLNDVLTYSFVHGDLLEAVGQKPQNSYSLVNAISPRLQYYRQTLTPSLLELVHPNIKAGFSEFSLLEINKTHNKVHGKDTEGLPGEMEMTAMVYASKKPQGGSAFYVIRRHLDFLASRLGLEFSYSPIDKEPNYPVTAPFDWKRSAYVSEKNSGIFIGIVGEYRLQVVKNMKLPSQIAGCELGTEDILKALQASQQGYTPLSKYPGTSQDITLEVPEEIAFSQVAKNIEDVLSATDFEWQLKPLSVYQAKNSKNKNLSFRIYLNDHSQTLTTKSAKAVLGDVASSAKKAFSAKVI